MKKTFLFLGMAACLAFGYAQDSKATKYGRVQNAGANDAKLKALIDAQKNEEPIKDCGDEHLGNLAFFNKSGKAISLELISSGGKVETVKITIPNGESVYVNDLLVGEYKYKKAGEKKPKKNALVNVQECTLKIVTLAK